MSIEQSCTDLDGHTQETPSAHIATALSVIFAFGGTSNLIESSGFVFGEPRGTRYAAYDPLSVIWEMRLSPPPLSRLDHSPAPVHRTEIPGHIFELSNFQKQSTQSAPHHVLMFEVVVNSMYL